MDVRRGADLPRLVQRAAEGDPRATARLISMVEAGSSQTPELARLTVGAAGRASVIGITGSPGVGKSTTTSAIVSQLRSRGQRVGVLAIDPSSPFSGGALLGDRIRMQDHATDPQVFIRSMASRGHLGGLAAATPAAVRVLDAAGCDTILVETVGVGQSEVEVVRVADTVLVLLAPGMGDGVQAAKAGILEIGDIFVVNKADRDGAAATCRELRNMISLVRRSEGDWGPPVLQTVASNGQGIAELVEAMDAHRAWSTEAGALRSRRISRAHEEIDAIVVAALRRHMGHGIAQSGLWQQAEAVVDGATDPYSAAAVLLGPLDIDVDPGAGFEPVPTGDEVA